MILRSTILGALLLQCILFAQCSGGCPKFSDPNTYIDDPNTLDNGLFEFNEPNLPECELVFPEFWDQEPLPESLTYSYASLVFRSEDPNIPCFEPQPEQTNNIGKVHWSIPCPYEGSSFALLSTGDHPVLEDQYVTGSSLSQQVYLSEGDTILGAYFYGTCDYPNYDDHGEIGLISIEDPNITHTIVDPDDPNDLCATLWVGAYGSTGKWMTFEYTLEEGMAGNYKINCKVEDGSQGEGQEDTIYKSYLAVDNLRICRGDRLISDIDYDCDVDLIDYSILSEAWLSFCPGSDFFNDPNTYDPNEYPPVADPNVINYEADLDDDWYVDANDLVIMLDPNEWLIKIPSD